MGQNEEKRSEQNKRRCRLVDLDDPSSPYRAMEVISQLDNQPEEELNTLADITQLVLQRHSTKQTMGTRQILDVQDEKQPNGKVFKKVRLVSSRFNQSEVLEESF